VCRRCVCRSLPGKGYLPDDARTTNEPDSTRSNTSTTHTCYCTRYQVRTSYLLQLIICDKAISRASCFLRQADSISSVRCQKLIFTNPKRKRLIFTNPKRKFARTEGSICASVEAESRFQILKFDFLLSYRYRYSRLACKFKVNFISHNRSEVLKATCLVMAISRAPQTRLVFVSSRYVCDQERHSLF
jgi:hypothetical protein